MHGQYAVYRKKKREGIDKFKGFYKIKTGEKYAQYYNLRNIWVDCNRQQTCHVLNLSSRVMLYIMQILPPVEYKMYRYMELEQ